MFPGGIAEVLLLLILKNMMSFSKLFLEELCVRPPEDSVLCLQG